MERELAELSEWLRGQLPEIEGLALARAHGVADPHHVEDPAYLAGLRAAVSAALEFGLAGVERGDERAGPVPAVLLTQARQAAGNGVDLDTVLRRCFAGHALLGDFVFRGINECNLALSGDDVRRLWQEQASLLDRLVDAMSFEFKSEHSERSRSSLQRRTEKVKKLLAGQLLDPRELDYELDAWHVGVVAVGPGASAALRDIAAALDRQLLSAAPVGETIWVWLGGGRRIPGDEVLDLAAGKCPLDVSLALGEPRAGIGGWRRTHREAKAASPVAASRPPSAIRYADVALLAAALQDDLLAGSLESTYLDPLSRERDGGAALRLTLRAYFAAGRNVSSAAAALEVSRQTVNSRLRTIEARIGRTIGVCAAELETALRLRELGHLAPSTDF